MDKNALNKETLDWIQKKLEHGKLPCKKCQHFESAHVKGICVACHRAEEDETKKNKVSCYHLFKIMDNLSIIEWVAKHKDEENL
jgi:hypothetical protein